MWQAICVIMGTMIGAGFASGKEIYNFFVRFNIYGLFGIVISSILTGVIIYGVFKILIKDEIVDEKNFIKKIRSNKYIVKVLNIFLLVLYYIMIAGFSSYFRQQYNISNLVTSTGISIVLYFVLINNIEEIVRVNEKVVPVLLTIMMIIIIKYNFNFINKDFIYIINNRINSISEFILSTLNSILYASYNSILLIPILIPLRKYIKTIKKAKLLSIIITILICLLTVGIYVILIKNNVIVRNYELPLLTIINNKFERYVYVIAIQIAILTSAISAGFAFLENLSSKVKKDRKKFKKIVEIMCITGIPISEIGFGNLISTLYPIFGLLGLIQIILILKKNVEKNSKN